MQSRQDAIRSALTPDTLALLQAIAHAGSLAGAARALGVVPSALTYRVRQVEDALDVLLFDRSSRQVRLTPAGSELLRESERLLSELDAVAQRVKRVASGWEPQLSIAADSLISRNTLLELCEAFYEQKPPTRLRLRAETLSGTWEVLVAGQVDLSIGAVVEAASATGIQTKPLGDVPFVFAVAPHHALALADEPLSDDMRQAHRAVAVADSTQRGTNISFGLLAGQDVLTVPNMQTKLDAQLRGLGCGFLPECLARPYIKTGRLLVKAVDRAPRSARVTYAWRSRGTQQGLALKWWLKALESPKTRKALLEAPGPSL